MPCKALPRHWKIKAGLHIAPFTRPSQLSPDIRGFISNSPLQGDFPDSCRTAQRIKMAWASHPHHCDLPCWRSQAYCPVSWSCSIIHFYRICHAWPAPFLVLTGSRTTAVLILLERVSPNVRFHYAAAVWPLLLSFPISPGKCMSMEHRIISGSEARQTADRFMSRAVPFTVEQRLKKNKRLFQVKGLLFSKCMLYFPMYLINQVKLFFFFFLLVHHVTFIAETKAHLGQFANR